MSLLNRINLKDDEDVFRFCARVLRVGKSISGRGDGDDNGDEGGSSDGG